MSRYGILSTQGTHFIISCQMQIFYCPIHFYMLLFEYIYKNAFEWSITDELRKHIQ